MNHTADEGHKFRHFGTSKDLSQALAALEVSTRAIEDYINAVKDAVVRLPATARNQPNHGFDTTAEKQQQSKSIEELRTDAQHRMRESAIQIQKTQSSTLITLEDTVSRQDHLLSTLEGHLKDVRESSSRDVARVDRLLRALEHTRSQTIRTRLDRRFLESLHAEESNGFREMSGQTTNSQVDLVQEDLQALYAEIPIVAQMLVNHEYGDKVGQATSQLVSAGSTLQVQNARDVAQRITDMTTRLEGLAQHAELLQSHRLTMQAIDEQFQSIDSVQSTEPSQTAAARTTRHGQHESDSVAVLKKYLGVSSSSMVQSKSDQINREFQAMSSQIESILAAKTTQQDQVLRQSHVGKGDGKYEAALGEVDNQIASVKAQLDDLPA